MIYLLVYVGYFDDFVTYKINYLLMALAFKILHEIISIDITNTIRFIHSLFYERRTFAYRANPLRFIHSLAYGNTERSHNVQMHVDDLRRVCERSLVRVTFHKVTEVCRTFN